MSMGIALVSCQNDDTDFDDIIAEYQVTPETIELDYSDLSEDADVPITDESDSAYNDYLENTTWNKVVYIEYSGDEVTVTNEVSGVYVTTDGGHVTAINMSGPVKFVLSGNTEDGSFKLYGDKRAQVLLNGLEMINPNGAAINNQGSKSFYLVTADDTYNSLTDGETYTEVDDEDQKATLFSEGQIIFSGSGTLNVYAVGKAAVRSDDYIRIRPGVNLYISSLALDGLRAKDGIIIDGGVINIETSGAGAKCVRSAGVMEVNGGRLVAINEGEPRIETTDGVTDTTACSALFCDTLLTINAGIIKLKTTGDGGKGLNANQNVVVNDGTFMAVATGTREIKKPKGVKIDGNFSISGGYFYSYSRRSDPLDVAGTTSVATGYLTYKLTAKLLTIAY